MAAQRQAGRAERQERGAPVADDKLMWYGTEADTHVRDIDPTVPHLARIYNLILGGKDFFPVDRDAAEAFITAFPGILAAARTGRQFLERAVRFLAADAGIRQFLDVGTGIPDANNTHEVAQAAAPDSRVVYVDNDPAVLAHARALLRSVSPGSTAFLDMDLRQTTDMLAGAAATLDFSQPIAVMLIGVLHAIPDNDDPYQVVAELVAAIPRGSYLVIGHPASDVEVEQVARATAGLNEVVAEPVTFRRLQDVARLFEGLKVLSPGLVQYPWWRPGPATPPPGEIAAWCGVAVKP